MTAKKKAALEAVTIVRACKGPKGKTLSRGQVLSVPADIAESDALFLVRLGKAKTGEHKIGTVAKKGAEKKDAE